MLNVRMNKDDGRTEDEANDERKGRRNQNRLMPESRFPGLGLALSTRTGSSCGGPSLGVVCVIVGLAAGGACSVNG